jgi:hypothetical protein
MLYSVVVCVQQFACLLGTRTPSMGRVPFMYRVGRFLLGLVKPVRPVRHTDLGTLDDHVGLNYQAKDS